MDNLIPEVIYIETTNICNAKCIMCPHNNLKRPFAVMDRALFNKIIDDLSNYDLSKTQLFLHKEGEPLCDKNIVEKINYANEKLINIKEIGINTNGMLLTKNVADNLINSGIDVIFFSLDGVIANIYNEIRKNCDYQLVENNIKYFLKKRLQYNKKIRVIMQMLINEQTEYQKQEYINKWKEYNVEFYFKKMHCYLDGGNSTFECPNFGKQISSCQDPFKILVYYVDGNTGPCCWDYNNEYNLGSAYDYTMDKLFNGQAMIKLRNNQLNLKCNNIKPCNRCGRIYGRDKISEY